MANIVKWITPPSAPAATALCTMVTLRVPVEWPCVVVVTVVLPVEEGVVDLGSFNPLRGTICETRTVPLPVGLAARWRLTPHPASENTPTATVATIETCRLIRMPPRGASQAV
ncbi:hypothetical protein CO251_14510 [Sulfobacillus sp. hq2]|nr:hypothetical protein CO251_14510 [Sulfobacillus sp. hq2]